MEMRVKPVSGTGDSLAGMTALVIARTLLTNDPNTDPILAGIALGSVWKDLEGSLMNLPSERAESPLESSIDELSQRRQTRRTG